MNLNPKAVFLNISVGLIVYTIFGLNPALITVGCLMVLGELV